MWDKRRKGGGKWGRMGLVMSKEVVLNGMLDHFEIWDKGVWQNQVRRTREDFTSFREGLSSLGIL